MNTILTKGNHMEGFQEFSIHIPKNIAKRIDEISKENGRSTIETIEYLLNLALDPESQVPSAEDKRSPDSSISDS
jgi:metal-responsive CopG/Arc/MetJ family transcriptional regulator